LGNLGEAAKPFIKDIADILKNDKEDANVRSSAAYALGNLGEVAKPYIKDIADFLKDKNVFPADSRARAVEALGKLGEAAKPYVKDILDFLKDENVSTDSRARGAQALVNLGEVAKPYVKDIADFLKNDKVDTNVRDKVTYALANIRKLEVNEIVVILNNVYQPNQQIFEQWRFLTYVSGGGTDEVKTLLKWLGYPKELPTQLKYEEGKKTLEVFRDAWAGSQGLERLRTDLADKIAKVARSVSWKPQDIPLLQTHYNNLKQAKYNQADTVQSAINDVALWKWFANARNTILAHIAFWLALIFAYPKKVLKPKDG
jgi:HEAT repeat protein